MSFEMDVSGRLLHGLIIVFFYISSVEGHGRLIEPPGRASMFRFGYDTPPNYSDNQMFCGGVQVQHEQNGGKCGICGDPYQGPRDHEAGGPYATGIIVRQYEMGSVIEVTWQLTANHKGYVEFRICPNNDITKAATQDCLDQYVLAQPDGTSRFMILGSDTGMYTKELQLPADLTCSQCVIQWKYHAGNSWGVDPDGTACVGCGDQEEFYACSDVMIGESAQQVTDPAEPNVPEGNDPNMDDYEEWDWDTRPMDDTSSWDWDTTPMDDTDSQGTDSASSVGCHFVVQWLCLLIWLIEMG